MTETLDKVDEIRQQFESCYSEKYGTPKSVLKVLRRGNEYSIEEGDRLNRAWEMWQASRAALVVELPAYRGAETYQSAGFNEALDECDTVIHAAGITVKGDSE